MPTLKVNFKSPTKASEFSKHFGVVGINAKVKVDGSAITISTSDSKTHDFVKQIVADLKGEAKMESTTQSFLRSIIESATNDAVVETTLYDGSRVSIDPSFASNFIKVHDSLSEETGQQMLRILAIESEQSFNKTKEFVAEGQE
jgi:hypothetical protein